MCRSDNWGDCRRPRGNLNAKAADSPGRFSTTIFTVLFHCFPEQMAGNRRVATFFKKYQCHCCLLKNLTMSTHHSNCVLAKGKTSVILMCSAKVAGGKRDPQVRDTNTKMLRIYLPLHTMNFSVFKFAGILRQN